MCISILSLNSALRSKYSENISGSFSWKLLPLLSVQFSPWGSLCFLFKFPFQIPFASFLWLKSWHRDSNPSPCILQLVVDLFLVVILFLKESFNVSGLHKCLLPSGYRFINHLELLTCSFLLCLNPWVQKCMSIQIHSHPSFFFNS